MKYLLLIFWLSMTSSTINCQVTIDTMMIDSILLKYQTSLKSEEKKEINSFIELIDKNLNSIIKNKFSYEPSKYTFIRSGEIEIRKIVGKKEALNFIINDTMIITNNGLTFKKLWEDLKFDTTKFLSHDFIYIKEDFFIIDNKFHVVKEKINPLERLNNSGLENIYFYDSQLNLRINQIFKRINRKNKKALQNYLYDNYDYFDIKTKKITPKAIQINYLVYDNSEDISIGIDIYGTHFLITVSKETMKILSTKELWVY